MMGSYEFFITHTASPEGLSPKETHPPIPGRVMRKQLGKHAIYGVNTNRDPPSSPWHNQAEQIIKSGPIKLGVK